MGYKRKLNKQKMAFKKVGTLYLLNEYNDNAKETILREEWFQINVY